MIPSERLALLLVLLFTQSDVNGSVIVKRDTNVVTGNGTRDLDVEKSLFGGPEERILEQEILKELNLLNTRKQREIFDDLEKQQEKFNVSQKSLVLSESENISPLNVEELKKIRKTIKMSNSTLPAVRNKRTLNFLLQALARAMGYTLTPSNPDAEWIPRQQPPPAQPCSSPPPPPCMPNPPSTPPPCAPPPPTTPPCGSSNALIQIPTISPNQIDANTISYPYRPARTIPLFNFAPLPAGVRVPYPPLLQALVQQKSPCTPSPPPCGTTPAPPPPCGTTPAPPPPCKPSPPPCGTTPAPPPPPCKPSPPPCGTTPAPPPPPCTTPAPRPPPCKPTCATPAPQPPPCKTTPAPPPLCAPPKPQPPPCTTPAPPPPPCTPAPPPCATPAPQPPPCATPAPPPPPCEKPPPPPPPSETPKKGTILLEYDDPVQIKIFSNDKKYLPASGNIYSGHEGDDKDWHAYFFPGNEKTRNKDEDIEEKEEMEEEHIEEEEDEETPGQLKHYEEEDERILANNEEDGEDESETNLSIVKKPAEQGAQKTHKRRPVSSKAQTPKDKKNEEQDTKREGVEKTQKMKKPKRKKWIRIVKKQRRKTKTDSIPHNNFQGHTSDALPEASNPRPKYFEKRESHSSIESYEKDISDFSSDDDSSSRSTEDVKDLDLKKITVSNEDPNSPELLREPRQYEFNFNPYAPEPEEQRRKKLEKAVERYVEDYVQKQLGEELIKNTGIPKTTVFEFTPKNGPKIQTITTTVAKSSHSGKPTNFKAKPETRPQTNKPPTGNAHILRKNVYEENSKKRGDFSYESFATRSGD